MQKSRIAYYVRKMASRGFSTEQVLAETGITEADLLNPWFRADAARYRRIINNMLTLTGDEFLGLSLGSAFKPSDLGMVGYAALSAPTLKKAREVILRYAPLNEYLVNPVNQLHEDRWYNQLGNNIELGNALPFAVEEFIARLKALSSALTGRDFPLLEIHLSYNKPGAARRYQAEFGCPCHFDRPSSYVVLDMARLDDTTALGDDSVFAMCLRQCDALYQRFMNQTNLSEQVRDILLQSSGEFPSVEQMARRLNKSPRTFRRQLSQEGTCYHSLTDQTRKSMALHYLDNTTLSPKEISYALGYRYVSNFRRAFKSWTGVSPSQYREGDSGLLSAA